MVTEAIKPGYNQTEVGVVPEDWDVVELVNIVENNNVPSGIYKEKLLYGSGTKIIKIGDVFKYDFFQPEDAQRVILNKTELIKNQAKIGDIFIALASVKLEGIGKVMFVNELDEETAYDHNVALIRIKERFDNKFVFYFLKSNMIRNFIRNLSTQVGTTFLKSSTIKKFNIFLPQLKKEQSAIAQDLSDTDELIQSLNKLITKKKNLKQGAMQELLTGKNRLPSFSGDWNVKLFGSLIEVNKGQQLNKSELTKTGEYPDWNGGIEPSGYTNKWNIVENTITISEGGNSCGFVNYCKQKFWCGGHCYALKITSASLDKIFLYQLLKFKEKSIMALRIGSGLPNIQKKNLNEFGLFIPKAPKEQSAIAQVLSNMEEDIEVLEMKRDKYKMIKRAMMQQLLTGRIRLKWKN